MHLDGVTLMAMIFLASFAIDRVVTALLFLFSFNDRFPDPDREVDPIAKAKAAKKYKLWYYGLAGIFAILAVADFGKVRILAAIGYPPDPNPMLDAILTAITLVGGADRLAALKLPGAPAESAEAAAKPLQVTGTLTLEEGSPRKLAARN